MPRKKRPPHRRHKHKGKSEHRPHHHLPPVCVISVSSATEDGELLATPTTWDERRHPPHIVITSGKAAKVGDRVLAKLKRIRPHYYVADVMRILPNEQPKEILGIYMATGGAGVIEPLSRKQKESYFVSREDSNGAQNGEMVRAITSGSDSGMRMQNANVLERLGSLNSPRAASMIATQMHELHTVFSAGALAEAEAAQDPTLEKNREDLRAVKLVTIDGEDARDFDDAVFAEEDGNGFHIIVAIADVAHYVEAGGALDADAHERGNSTYFPDRVIPMLPERLSNGLCSLVPNQDRFCLAVHIWIDRDGNCKRYKFVRGLMRSHHRFTYEELQAAQASHSHAHYKDIIRPLYAAYDALCVERDRREPLGLNLPEFKIRFDDKGEIAAIIPREQLESHRLIESYMIAANVAAADFLLKNNRPGIYRVHEHPDEEKLDELRQFIKLSGYSLQSGAISSKHLNRVLKKSSGKAETFMIHSAVLRAQMQAYYSPECLGHFGLSLQKYCHFTSPIRRYSDLIVHREIIHILEKTKSEARGLAHVAEHISDTERRSMLAERDASDRYKVSYMQRHIGDRFTGVISGLNEHGMFVTINQTGITGFIPIRNLPGDFYLYEKRRGQFRGRRSKRIFHIGQPIVIDVQEANRLTGSLIFSLGESRHDHPAPQQSPKGTAKWRKKGKKH